MLLGDSGEHTHTATIHVRFEIASCIALPGLDFSFYLDHCLRLKCWSDFATCRWHHHEAHAEEVCKGQIWLQDVVCTGDLKAIAVTSQTWLRAVWAEEEIEITNSKADYIFADAGAAEKLPEPPAQPSEAQLLELLKDIKGVYEAKPSRHVQGTLCCNLEINIYCLLCVSTIMDTHQVL